MNTTVDTKKLADLDAAMPGLAAVWRAVKADIHTSVRGPKTVRFTDEPSVCHMNDGECGARFELDLATMTIGTRLRMSSGEWACHAGSNNDLAVGQVPNGKAMITVTWHDFYRYVTFEIQVAKGALAPRLSA